MPCVQFMPHSGGHVTLFKSHISHASLWFSCGNVHSQLTKRLLLGLISRHTPADILFTCCKTSIRTAISRQLRMESVYYCYLKTCQVSNMLIMLSAFYQDVLDLRGKIKVKTCSRGITYTAAYSQDNSAMIYLLCTLVCAIRMSCAQNTHFTFRCHFTILDHLNVIL